MQRSDWDPDWHRLKEICNSALRLPLSERSAFVAEACLEDPALISEVNSLLAAYKSSQTLVRSASDMLVTLVEFKHR